MNELDAVATVSHGICALLPRLRRFACAIAGHPADADDLLQVAIERALRHYAQWRPETPLQYWLFGISVMHGSMKFARSGADASCSSAPQKEKENRSATVRWSASRSG
ncbi:RNA polymerase sigma factor [Xanthomonas vasicola]|uniref:RNA polymerase sigma factor n=1 Tax=Xanthomonas vasicola TaxID=56459 RepID=UPI00034907D7|nr:sigma factor [Xanthomonas vasicola]MDO6970341.1 sigma factor [Xanthomonas vasicola]